jgi:hypothetical protein
MKKILPLIIISLIFGCSSQKETELLSKLSKSLNSETKQKFQTIEVFNKHDSKIEPLLYEKFQNLDSSYRFVLNKIDSTTDKSIINEQLKNHEVLGRSITDEDVSYSMNEVPNSNSSEYGKIELAMFTNEVLYQLTALIGHDELRFDEIRALVKHGETTIKLGEVFDGRVYLAATSSQPLKKVYYLLNGDTLNTVENYAEFSYMATKRGTQVLKFEVSSDRHSTLDGVDVSAEEVKVIVE